MRTYAIRAATLAAVLLAATVTAASASSGGMDKASKKSSQLALSLTMANPTVASDLLDYVGKYKGFFAQQGLDLTILDQYPAPSTASYVVSGKVDIGLYAGVTPLVVASEGQPTSIILGLGGGGQGGLVIGRPNGISSMADLQSQSSCRIGTFPPGSSAYGWAVTYELEFHLKCDLVPFSDATSQAGALASGRVDVLVGAYPNFVNLVQQGQAKILIDTRNPVQQRKFTGPYFPEVVLWGLTKTLEAKRPAVVAYLKGLYRTYQYVQTASTQQLTAALKSFPEFSGLTDQVIGVIGDTIKAYTLKGGVQGYITPAQWTLGLQRFASWGVPGFDASAANNAYNLRVDMSYYRAALGDPTILRFSYSPASPKAGLRFSVKGQWIESCSATLAGKVLKGECSWQLPKSAKGKRLTVRVHGYTNAHSTKVFTVGS